jgi:hypothetical protein
LSGSVSQVSAKKSENDRWLVNRVGKRSLLTEVVGGNE